MAGEPFTVTPLAGVVDQNGIVDTVLGVVNILWRI